MKRLPTVEAAKKEIKELQDFVFLVENYETSNLEEQILKEYAYLGSIKKVVEKINSELETDIIDCDFVRRLIQSKPKDNLHKVLKSNYLLKTRPARRQPGQYNR